MFEKERGRLKRNASRVLVGEGWFLMEQVFEKRIEEIEMNGAQLGSWIIEK